MRILFLSSWFPYPPINGAKVRVNNLLRPLLSRHEVTLISFVNTLSSQKVSEEIESARQAFRGIVAVPAEKTNRQASILGLFSPLPRSVKANYSARMAGAIGDALMSGRFDVVIASEVGDGTGIAYYASIVRRCPKILDDLEIALYIDRLSQSPSLLGRFRFHLGWLKMQRYLRDLTRRFDACTAPSALEENYIRRRVSSDIRLEVIPHSLDLDHWRLDGSVAPQQGSLVFSGALTYFPNRDGVAFFLEEVMPLISRSAPEANLTVLGDADGFDSAARQATGRVNFSGHCWDVRPSVQKAWATVVPLRHGSGTRVKILESMALGTPVISTSKGAEGLEVTPEEDILIADGPGEFAAQTLRLLRDPWLRTTLSVNGRRLIEDKYDMRVVGERFNQLIESVVEAGKRA